MRNIIRLLFLLCVIVMKMNTEMLTSEVDLQRVLAAEKDLSLLLDDYIEAERDRITQLESISQELRQHSKTALEDPKKSLGNLISSFLTVKRFTVDWEDIVNSYIYSPGTEQIRKQIDEVASHFPSKEDLESSAAALMRLQDTYDLTPAAMANGQVQGVATDVKLLPRDCFEVGRIAYDKGDYYHAILWIEHALNESKSLGYKGLDMGLLYDYLNYAYFLRDDLVRARELAVEWLQLEPDHQRAKQNLKHYDLLLQNQTCSKDGDACQQEKKTLKRQRNEWQSQESFQYYEQLCRGEEPIVYELKHQLVCNYKYPLPMLSYAPIREEILRFDPPIAVYHDVLTEEEMEKARELAIPKLHRSGVFTTNSRADPFTEHRTSKTSWIPDSEHPIIKRISQKSSVVSGLSLDTVEQLQVVNYGIGGHYEPHYDFSRAGENPGYTLGVGNRIATVIFYLAEVEAGGATVFPELGVRVTPVKGSCAVWFNLLQNGEQDYRTLHAGCPVLTGSKWIGTKWYHEAGQEFLRKCDVNPNL